jgi:hypothetical protein
MQLNFPPIDAQIRVQNGKQFIYDIIRKKYIVLTPEEWVRQHLVHFLINERQCPKGLIAVERGLKHNGLQRRFDVVVYSRNLTPWLIVECKAPQVAITQQTFDQIARYNMSLQVPYLLVTNGLQHFCCEIDYLQRSFSYLQDVPSFL